MVQGLSKKDFKTFVEMLQDPKKGDKEWMQFLSSRDISKETLEGQVKGKTLKGKHKINNVKTLLSQISKTRPKDDNSLYGQIEKNAENMNAAFKDKSIHLTFETF